MRIPPRLAVAVALPTLAPLLAVLASPATAQAAATHAVTGTFVAEHGASGAVRGTVSGTFDPATGTLRYRATYAGLSGPVEAAHFHGPAKPPAEAGVMKPIDAPYASPIAGTWTLTGAQAAALKAGEVYVNLHTAAFPGGEARADLTER